MLDYSNQYLVTGVAGFVGWHVAKLLVAQGYNVVGIDNLNDYYDVRLKKWRLEQLSSVSDQFSFIECDIEDYRRLDDLFQRNQFAAVVNLAARAGVRYSIENPHIYFTTNANGSLNLLELMRKYEVKKYLLASTSSLYAGQPMPFHEDLPVNQPISPYAASKKAAEVTAYTYHHLFDIDATVVRYFTVYGPAGRPDMSVFRFIQWIDLGQPIRLYGDGSYKRDFTYVEDIAAGTVFALRPTGYEIINLGGGNSPTSINQMIGIIEEVMGKKAHIDHQPSHPADMDVTWANIDKAKSVLDWSPKVTLQEGLERSVKWYFDNRELASSIQTR